MSPESPSRSVAFLVASEGIEHVELADPWDALAGAGFTPVLLSPEAGEVQTVNHDTPAEKRPVDRPVGEASVEEYAALVLPGGVANPDALRLDEDAVGFIRRFVATGRPVAAICHAPWTLIEAGVVDGRRVTSWPSLRTDLTNAGAEWVDEPVVVDGALITSRKPDDLPHFTRAILQALASR